MRGLAGMVMGVCLLVTGCGGGEVAGSPTPEAAPSPTPTAAPERSLKDTCPLIEQATPNGAYPGEGRLAVYVSDLDELAAQGDVETDNALKILRAAVQDMRGASGSAFFDAHSGWLHALDVVADRCKAVGSSALQ